MRSCKQFCFPSSRQHSFDQSINFIWFSTGLSDLRAMPCYSKTQFQVKSTSETITSQSMFLLIWGSPLIPTRQCSLLWFNQWPVLPVRIILCNWFVLIQTISSTRRYLWKRKRYISSIEISKLPPKLKALTSQFHSSSCDPQEHESFILKLFHW